MNFCSRLQTIEEAMSAARYLDAVGDAAWLFWMWTVARLLNDEPGGELQWAAIRDAVGERKPSQRSWRLFLVTLGAREPRKSTAFVIDAMAASAMSDAETSAVRSITQAVARTFLEDSAKAPEAVFAPVRRLADALTPTDTLRIDVAIPMLLRLGWDPAASVLTPYLVSVSQADAVEHMSLMTDFARPAIAAGHARSFRVLLDETHLAGRWRPLAEALDCVVANDTSHLLRLPAEIRAATEDLLATLAPGLPPSVARKKRHRART